MDVHYQVKHGLQSSTLATVESLTFYIGLRIVRTDGRTDGHVITKISRMDRLPNFLRYGAPLARGAPL